MKEWRRENDWGGEKRGGNGRQRKGRRLRREGKGEEGGNERRKVGWGSIASCSQGG
jgi:hypothetical protein